MFCSGRDARVNGISAKIETYVVTKEKICLIKYEEYVLNEDANIPFLWLHCLCLFFLKFLFRYEMFDISSWNVNQVFKTLMERKRRTSSEKGQILTFYW